MAQKDSGFMVNKPTSLDAALVPPVVNRLFQKDISRQSSLPMNISKGAITGVIPVVYYANALAGNFTGSVSLSEFKFKRQPLSLVWYMGSRGKDGSSIDGGGIINSSPYDNGLVITGTEIALSATANCCTTKDAITVKITSLNVGWPIMMQANFYYVIYYDDLGILDNYEGQI